MQQLIFEVAAEAEPHCKEQFSNRIGMLLTKKG